MIRGEQRRKRKNPLRGGFESNIIPTRLFCTFLSFFFFMVVVVGLEGEKKEKPDGNLNKGDEYLHPAGCREGGEGEKPFLSSPNGAFPQLYSYPYTAAAWRKEKPSEKFFVQPRTEDAADTFAVIKPTLISIARGD